MRRFLAIVLSVVLGCSAPPSRMVTHPPNPSSAPVRVVPVLIDADFTEAEAGELNSAVAVWETALNGLYDFQVTYGWKASAEDVLKLEESGAGIAMMAVGAADMPGDSVLAFVNDLGGHRMYFSMERIGKRSLRGVAMHEIGHALGLPHIPVKGTVMYPSYDQGWTEICVDEMTMRLMAELDERVSMEHVVYCRMP